MSIHWNRRTFIKGATIAVSTPAIVLAPCALDPIIGAINTYRDAVRNLINNADKGADAAFAKAIDAPLANLESWSSPAISREGAMEALRAAHDDMQKYEPDGPVPALVAAALAFFEQSE